MIKFIRRFVAKIFLDVILKPSGIHAWIAERLKVAEKINAKIWRMMGAKMLSVYQWVLDENNQE